MSTLVYILLPIALLWAPEIIYTLTARTRYYLASHGRNNGYAGAGII